MAESKIVHLTPELSEALQEFDNINWADRKAAHAYFVEQLLAQVAPEKALRMTESEHVQNLEVVPDALTAKLNRVTDDRVSALRVAIDALEDMSRRHQMNPWAHIDSLPAAGIGILRKLDMIDVVKIDGEHRGQIKGVYKNA